jgi:hypothetical protein
LRILLARGFRSLEVVILDVMSVGAAHRLIRLVWQDGHGSRLI